MRYNIRKTSKLAAAGLITLYGSVAMAGQVGTMNSFTAGSPAVAADVNANFGEHTTQINDNDARIAALESKMDALTGGQCLSGTLAGQYKVVTHESYFVEKPNGTGTVDLIGAAIGVVKGNVVFDTSGNWTYTETSRDYAEQFVGGTSGATWDTTVDATPVSGTYTLTSTCKLTLMVGTTTVYVLHMSPDLYSGSAKATNDQPSSADPSARFWEVDLVTVHKKNM